MPKRKPKDPERSPDLPHDWIERHLTRMAAFLTHDAIELTTWQYRRAHLTGPGSYHFLDAGWNTIDVGEMWGGPDTTAFFRKTIEIPKSHAGSNTYLDIDMDGGETQLSINGRPWQGLDFYRHIVPLGEFAEAGRVLELEMEAFIINYPYDERRQDMREKHLFSRARLVKRDPDIEAFLIDANFVLRAYQSLWQDDSNPELEAFLLHHLEAACLHLGPNISKHSEALGAARKARAVLRENIFESRSFQHPGSMTICAHSHLDILYLWPIKETLRKNCRTVTNVLSLMREYPDFHFSYSQPYLYEKLKEMYPTVFAEVQERVREGRWEVIGAMYVEPDGNLLGAESLVRQILFGVRSIREAFDIHPETCWLPDVFGLMYTLPQILRKCGIKYCNTAKLNIWNDTNIFPHDTFRWRGPDGSEVITHFPPTHFAQEFSFKNLRRHWQDFREKRGIAENLFVYGLADGGGGPTREEVVASLQLDSFPGFPETNIGFAESFFNRLEEKYDQLPVWDDELYLEAHRGTYTTKGNLKRQNRKAELLYRDAEILSSMASLYGGPKVQDELNEGWRHLLLNQFHDTLPGTHRAEGVPDIEHAYEAAFAIGRKVRQEAIDFLVDRLDKETAVSHDLLLFNTLAWERNAMVATESRETAKAVKIGEGDWLPVQHYYGRTYFRAPSLPSMGWTIARFSDEDLAKGQQKTADRLANRIETPYYIIELGPEGTFEQIFDKVAERYVLAAPGNVFQVFEDDPGQKFSAWDIAYHLETYQYPVKQSSRWQLVDNGPLFAVFKSEWKVLNSTIEQEMWLFADTPGIEFHTRVEWQDKRKLLKVAFPLAVRSRTATFDLPFGNIERATHRNTSWEQAKFEVCGHKWADMSEGNYGVAVLNDCKYGYDAKENVLRLSLLRSPIRPDADSDMGFHEFTYVLLPHTGGWRQAEVLQRAYELNIPALAKPLKANRHNASNCLPRTLSLLKVASPSLVVETLKQAESGLGLILRSFDSQGHNHTGTFTFGPALECVEETNMLEEQPVSIALANPHNFHSHFEPYEIKTHRLKFS